MLGTIILRKATPARALEALIQIFHFHEREKEGQRGHISDEVHNASRTNFEICVVNSKHDGGIEPVGMMTTVTLDDGFVGRPTNLERRTRSAQGEQAKALHIIYFGIFPTHQKRGIATLAVRKLSESHKCVAVHTHPSTCGQFWLNMGFEPPEYDVEVASEYFLHAVVLVLRHLGGEPKKTTQSRARRGQHPKSKKRRSDGPGDLMLLPSDIVACMNPLICCCCTLDVSSEAKRGKSNDTGEQGTGVKGEGGRQGGRGGQGGGRTL